MPDTAEGLSVRFAIVDEMSAGLGDAMDRLNDIAEIDAFDPYADDDELAELDMTDPEQVVYARRVLDQRAHRVSVAQASARAASGADPFAIADPWIGWTA